MIPKGIRSHATLRYELNCTTSGQCKKVKQFILIGRHWGRNDLGTVIALAIKNKENTMGNIKNHYQELQDAADEINAEMTQEEMDDTIDLMMKEEAEMQDKLYTTGKRLAFTKGFIAGWAFVVILNIISYIY